MPRRKRPLKGGAIKGKTKTKRKRGKTKRVPRVSNSRSKRTA